MNGTVSACAFGTLSELIDHCDKAGCWLESTYQNVMFTPQELRDANRRGEFRWSPGNWKIITREELIEKYTREEQEAVRALGVVRNKLAALELSKGETK